MPSEIANELNKFTVHAPLPSTSSVMPVIMLPNPPPNDSTATSPKTKKKKGKEKMPPNDSLTAMELK